MSPAATYLTSRRLRLYPLAILMGATIGWMFFVASSTGLRAVHGGRVGGDLPAFYGAGRIIARTPMALYDPAVLRDAQSDLLPGNSGGWIHFAYPPYVAVAYVPFTWLNFKTAYVVHTLLMVTCVLLALALLRPLLLSLRREFAACAAAALTFYPLFRSIVGGQNTALSLLCAAGAAAMLSRKRDVAAGLWIGLWMFKPQYAIPVGALIAVCGRPRIVVGAVIVSAAWFLVGASVAGWSWPLWWWHAGVLPVAALDAIIERATGVSFPQVAAAAGVPLLGWLGVAATSVFAIVTAWRSRREPLVTVAIGAAACVLTAPHALYYDAGLAVLAFAVAADAAGRRALPVLIASWCVAALQPVRFFPLPADMLVLAVSILLLSRTSLQVFENPTQRVEKHLREVGDERRNLTLVHRSGDCDRVGDEQPDRRRRQHDADDGNQGEQADTDALKAHGTSKATIGTSTCSMTTSTGRLFV
ncbi:MAG TPA: glycosyltransferase family 87 protein [Vicinamibacterales bacterium]|jgi:hypothetical protein